MLHPSSHLPKIFPQPNTLNATADAPPDWKAIFQSIPLIETYLNIVAQAQSYYATMRSCMDFMDADLEKGLQSEWIGKRVGVKEKVKGELTGGHRPLLSLN